MGFSQMADATNAEKLREMAEHRGLRLIRSRKRKPGTGDYGKYGLSTTAGKPLFGVGDQGLEASGEEIEAFLRADAVGTWKASSQISSAPPKPNPSKPAPPKHVKQVRKQERARPPTAKKPLGKITKPAFPEPSPKPELAIRPAKPGDAATLLPLLCSMPGVKLDKANVARNLDAVLQHNTGVIVAELGDIIGCCAWVVLPTIQHGPMGRLTLLLVAEDHRRSGIATALVNAVVLAMRKSGCGQLEAMSDIDIRNAHGFFRALDFKQISYRFARAIRDGAAATAPDNEDHP